jgi:hypothetical protein
MSAESPRPNYTRVCLARSLDLAKVHARVGGDLLRGGKKTSLERGDGEMKLTLITYEEDGVKKIQYRQKFPWTEEVIIDLSNFGAVEWGSCVAIVEPKYPGKEDALASVLIFGEGVLEGIENQFNFLSKAKLARKLATNEFVKHEVQPLSPEEKEMGELKNAILRKVEILVESDVDVAKIWPQEKVNKKIKVGPIDDGRTVFGQPDREIQIGVYSYPGYRCYKNRATGVPLKNEIHATIKYKEEASLHFELDELETGEMRLDFSSADFTNKEDFVKDGFERQASLRDLQIFDKLLSSAVSKVLGELPWEEQEKKLEIQEKEFLWSSISRKSKLLTEDGRLGDMGEVIPLPKLKPISNWRKRPFSKETQTSEIEETKMTVFSKGNPDLEVDGSLKTGDLYHLVLVIKTKSEPFPVVYAFTRSTASGKAKFTLGAYTGSRYTDRELTKEDLAVLDEILSSQISGQFKELFPAKTK